MSFVRFNRTRVLGLVAAIIGTLTCSYATLPPETRTTYYFGEVKMTSPTGMPYGSTLSLVERTVRPEEKKIVERVMSISLNEPTTEYVTIFDVEGSKMRLTDEGGTFTGEGDLSGRAWEWNGWRYTATMSNGQGVIKGEDSLTADAIIVKKSFHSPDGKPRVLFTEDLRAISKETYQILHAKLSAK